MPHLQTSGLAEHGMPPYQRLNKVHPAVLAQIFGDREKPIMASPSVWRNPKNWFSGRTKSDSALPKEEAVDQREFSPSPSRARVEWDGSRRIALLPSLALTTWLLL